LVYEVQTSSREAFLMSKRVAVVLSGCGVNDGSEVQEAVLTLLALDLAGVQYQCAAPDKAQADVINHLTGEPMDEQRNVLVESARIARGNIVPLAEIKADDYDAVFLPGGFGAAKNLSTYAIQGVNATVDQELTRVLREFHRAGKPVGAVCIAPMALASVFADTDPRVSLTIGTDKGTADDLKTLGGMHRDCSVSEFIVDEKNKVVTSPAYMLGKAPAEVFEGIRKAVDAVLKLA
jgi:enhancing lycopene biosynthesis protein 2